jgi:hypothetical protein
MHGRRAEADLGAVVLAELGDEIAVGDGHAVHLLQEVDMEEGAAEFAVGDALQADLLLLRDQVADAFVLDGAQRVGRQGFGEKPVARLGQARGAQKTADMVGAEGRDFRHGSRSPHGGA